MYARATTLYIKRDMHEAAINLFKFDIIPTAKKQEGYQGTYLLTNSNAGKFRVITFWRDISDAVANEKSGYYDEQIAKLDRYIIGPPEVEAYKVESLDVLTTKID
jgi:heme-degrading monooxygenase HmoA